GDTVAAKIEYAGSPAKPVRFRQGRATVKGKRLNSGRLGSPLSAYTPSQERGAPDALTNRRLPRGPPPHARLLRWCRLHLAVAVSHRLAVPGDPQRFPEPVSHGPRSSRAVGLHRPVDHRVPLRAWGGPARRRRRRLLGRAGRGSVSRTRRWHQGELREGRRAEAG